MSKMKKTTQELPSFATLDSAADELGAQVVDDEMFPWRNTDFVSTNVSASTKPRRKHVARMRSLKKGYSVAALGEFLWKGIYRTLSPAKQKDWKTPIGAELIARPKFDGIPVSTFYAFDPESGVGFRVNDSMATRGDGGDGVLLNIFTQERGITVQGVPPRLSADMLAELLVNINTKVPLIIDLRTELTVHAKRFDPVLFASPRTQVAATVNSKQTFSDFPLRVFTAQFLELIVIDPTDNTEYRWFDLGHTFERYHEIVKTDRALYVEDSAGCLVTDLARCDAELSKIDSGEFGDLLTEMSNDIRTYHADPKKGYPFLTDGIVFTVNDPETAKKMGCTKRYPKYAFAIKWEPHLVSAIITHISFSVATSGELIPQVWVDTKGSPDFSITIKKINAYKLANLLEHGYRPGDKVLVGLRGGTIPFIAYPKPTHKLTTTETSVRMLEKDTGNQVNIEFAASHTTDPDFKYVPCVCPQCGATMTWYLGNMKHPANGCTMLNEATTRPSIIAF